jgi:TldD protein
MKEHANLALNLPRNTALRGRPIVERNFEAVYLKNRAIEGVVNTHSYGRDPVSSTAFGFAANPDLNPAKIEIAVKRAVDIARASAAAGGEPTRLSPEKPVVGEWRSPCVDDPFEVPLETKIGHLLACEEAMACEKGVAVTRSSMNFLKETALREHRGASITQRVLQSGGGIA